MIRARNRIAADNNIVRTNPDPSELTVDLVNNSITAVKETINARLDAIDKATLVFSENLTRVPTAVDRAILQLRELLEARIHELESLRALDPHQFAAIQETMAVLKATVNERFELNDGQIEKAFNAAKHAVAEQNSANAQAIAKSEINVAKSIDDLRTSLAILADNTEKRIEINRSGVNDKIDDIKARLTVMEGRSSVADPATASALRELTAAMGSLTTSRDRGAGGSLASANAWGIIVAIIMGAIAAVAVIVDIVKH